MASFRFVILFGLSFVLISCEGKITSPSDGTEFIFLPGSSWNLTWTFDDEVSEVSSRTWNFESYDGLITETLGAILTTFPPQVSKDKLPGIEIRRPAILELKNVSYSYDGNYTFTLLRKDSLSHTSKVLVYIAKKPTVKLYRSGPITVIEGDNVTCECCGEGGRPPANVTWSKDGNQIGGIGKECKTLTLNNVDGTHNGTYKCEARSYVGDDYVDAKYIDVLVKPKLKPMKTTIKIKPNQTTVGNDVEITCSSEGVPGPDFTIRHPNGTNITLTGNQYIIKNVQKSDNGTYTCVARNEIGEDTATGNLNVTGPTPTTNSSSKPSSSSYTPSGNGNKGSVLVPTPSPPGPKPPVGLIVGIVIGVLVLLLIVCVVVYRYKKKEKEGGNRANIDPAAGNHYELENEDAGPADNAYDSVGPVGTSSGKSKPPEKSSLPPVYAAVDKNNRQGNTLYASLDTDAMKPKRESKKEPERTPQTEYASIDFAKRVDDNVPKADLV